MNRLLRNSSEKNISIFPLLYLKQTSERSLPNSSFLFTQWPIKLVLIFVAFYSALSKYRWSIKSWSLLLKWFLARSTNVEMPYWFIYDSKLAVYLERILRSFRKFLNIVRLISLLPSTSSSVSNLDGWVANWPSKSLIRSWRSDDLSNYLFNCFGPALQPLDLV